MYWKTMEIFVRTSERLYIGMVAQRHCANLVGAPLSPNFKASTYLEEFLKIVSRNGAKRYTKSIFDLW